MLDHFVIAEILRRQREEAFGPGGAGAGDAIRQRTTTTYCGANCCRAWCLHHRDVKMKTNPTLRVMVMIENGLSKDEIVVLLLGEGFSREDIGYIYTTAETSIRMWKMLDEYKRNQ